MENKVCNLCGFDFSMSDLENVEGDTWLCDQCATTYYKEKALYLEAEVRKNRKYNRGLKLKIWSDWIFIKMRELLFGKIKP